MSSIFFRESGAGHPLVLLHGFCESHEIWSEFAPPISSQYRVLMPDLPGFGKSELLHGDFTIDDVGDSIAGWLRSMQITKAVIVGHSLGGYVALSIAHRHPSLVAGFGLFHSTAFSDSPEKKENRDRIIAFVKKNGVPPYIDTFVPGLFFDKQHPAIPFVRKIALGTNASTLIGYARAMRDRVERTAVLSNSIPKVLIAGEGDTLIDIKSSLKMAEMGRNLQFFSLKDVGHMGLFEDKSECQSIITRFTESLFSDN